MSTTLVLDSKLKILCFLQSVYKQKIKSSDTSVAEKEYYKVLLNEVNNTIDSIDI